MKILYLKCKHFCSRGIYKLMDNDCTNTCRMGFLIKCYCLIMIGVELFPQGMYIYKKLLFADKSMHTLIYDLGSPCDFI